MNVYFARISEETTGESIILAKDGSIDGVARGFGSEIVVKAIYSVELNEQETEMFQVLLGIDSAIKQCLVEDLIVKIFSTGRDSR